MCPHVCCLVLMNKPGFSPSPATPRRCVDPLLQAVHVLRRTQHLRTGAQVVFDDGPAIEAGDPSHGGRNVAAQELAGLPC